MNDKDLMLINISGKDQKGIIADISEVLAEYDVNIIDIKHTVIHNMFAMFMIVDLEGSRMSYEKLQGKLAGLKSKFSIDIEYNKLESGMEAKSMSCLRKKNYVLSVVAKDHSGIVYALSRCLCEYGVNIWDIALVARDKLINIEMVVDVGQMPVTEIRNILRNKGESLGVDIIFQREDIFRREKRLVVFDMDSTIVDAEIMDEIAKEANVEDEVTALTKGAMEGDIDFKSSLNKRVMLLRGLDESILRSVYDNLKLTPGAEELIRVLKIRGYKIALVSGGFTYFTDKFKNRLHMDHTYANKLVIRDHKITGEIEGEIIDAEKKGEIIEHLRLLYGLRRDQVVAIGDGANDQIMLENAGLSIAFNAKDVLKKVSSGVISKDNMIGILNILGIGVNEY